MKRYIAKFKIYNGEATYTIPVITEAKNKKEAKQYFKCYEVNGEIDIWKLQVFDEVKDFNDLWGWL